MTKSCLAAQTLGRQLREVGQKVFSAWLDAVAGALA
jgi:hypothetical protein